MPCRSDFHLMHDLGQSSAIKISAAGDNRLVHLRLAGAEIADPGIQHDIAGLEFGSLVGQPPGLRGQGGRVGGGDGGGQRVESLLQLDRRVLAAAREEDAQMPELGWNLVAKDSQRLILLARHQHPLPLREQSRDQVGDRVGLPGAGRALDDDADLGAEQIQHTQLLVIGIEREQRVVSEDVAPHGTLLVEPALAVGAFGFDDDLRKGHRNLRARLPQRFTDPAVSLGDPLLAPSAQNQGRCGCEVRVRVEIR